MTPTDSTWPHQRALVGPLTFALFVAAACGRGQRAQDARVAEIGTSDVHHFVDAWKQIVPADASCAPLTAYFREETRGLRAYRRKLGMAQADLCAAIRLHPDGYARLESKLPALDSIATTIRAQFATYLTFDPTARAPAVYFVVGAGRSAGTTTRGGDPIILIGMELNRSVDGLAWTVAHEMAHTQQHYPFLGAMNGGPTFLRGSLLRHSIMEGSADLVAELLTGQLKRNAYGEAHEPALWQEFQRDAHSRTYDRWLYNGWDVKGRGDRAADLGYWMGYRITKSYFERASDKRQALRDILTIKDFDRFLAASGYDGVASPARVVEP